MIAGALGRVEFVDVDFVEVADIAQLAHFEHRSKSGESSGLQEVLD